MELTLTSPIKSNYIANVTATQQSASQSLPIQKPRENSEVTGLVIMSLVLVALVGTAIALDNAGKGKLGTARFANRQDKLAAIEMFYKCLAATKAGKPYPSALWCGTPQYKYGWLPVSDKFKAQLEVILHGTLPTLYLPDIGRGWLVIGGPGSGKTFSSIDRALHSAFQQGMAVAIYDKKGDQMMIHTALATMYGYEVHVFAPGEDYSCIINPLDFLRDSSDATTAGVLGELLMSKKGDNQGNDFFDMNGRLLAKGLMQAAKDSKYPDLAMVYAICQLPSFVKRLDYAVNRTDGKRLSPWVAASFSSFLSSKDSEKTAASILTTASITFTGLMQKDLLPCFLGKTSIPLKLKQKQMVVFKLDDRRRDVISPILKMCMRLCFVENLAEKRRGLGPFAYCLDELPSLGKFDGLPEMVNEYRSNGGIPITGVQNEPQIQEAYGDKLSKALLAGLATITAFNPNDVGSNEQMSKKLGNKQVTIANRSVSRSFGSNGGGSSSTSYNTQQVALISLDELEGFPQGKCVVLNPGYGNEQRTRRPLVSQIRVPQADIDLANRCEETLWSQKIRPALIERYSQQRLGDVGQTYNLASQALGEDLVTSELRKRLLEAEQLFPLPPESKK